MRAVGTPYQLMKAFRRTKHQPWLITNMTCLKQSIFVVRNFYGTAKLTKQLVKPLSPERNTTSLKLIQNGFLFFYLFNNYDFEGKLLIYKWLYYTEPLKQGPLIAFM